MVKRIEKFDVDDILDMLDEVDPGLRKNESLIDDHDIIEMSQEKVWIKYRDYIIGIFIVIMIVIIIIAIFVLIKRGRSKKKRSRRRS